MLGSLRLLHRIDNYDFVHPQILLQFSYLIARMFEATVYRDGSRGM